MTHHLVNQLVHVMWPTQDLQHFISPLIRNSLHAYITNIIKAKNGKVFATGGSTNHIHLLLQLPSEISLSTLVKEIKACSSKWIKSQDPSCLDFAWQQGYFGVSTQSDKISQVCSYIQSDESRHKTKSFQDELKTMLELQDMDYNTKFFLQNTHAKIYIHIVWSTYNRIPWLDNSMRQNLYSLMSDIVKGNRGFVNGIGGVEDHVHVLIEAPKDKSLSDLVKDVKTSASHWIKKQNPLKYNDFHWQVGFGAFTISYSSLKSVKEYIDGQEEHHRQQNFKQEWEDFLQKNGYQIPCWPVLK